MKSLPYGFFDAPFFLPQTFLSPINPWNQKIKSKIVIFQPDCIATFFPKCKNKGRLYTNYLLLGHSKHCIIIIKYMYYCTIK